MALMLSGVRFWAYSTRVDLLEQIELLSKQICELTKRVDLLLREYRN